MEAGLPGVKRRVRLSLPHRNHLNDGTMNTKLSASGGVFGKVSRPSTTLPLPQIMAAVRCKRSKWWFLARTFCGKDWQEHELFYPPTDVRAGTYLLHEHLNVASLPERLRPRLQLGSACLPSRPLHTATQRVLCMRVGTHSVRPSPVM